MGIPVLAREANSISIAPGATQSDFSHVILQCGQLTKSHVATAATANGM